MVDRSDSVDGSGVDETKIVHLDSRRNPRSELYSITGGVVRVAAAAQSIAFRACANGDNVVEEIKYMERRTASFLDTLLPLMQRVISKIETPEVRVQLIDQLVRKEPEGLFRDSTVRCLFLDECVHYPHLLREDIDLFKAVCAQFRFPSSTVCKKAAEVLVAMIDLPYSHLEQLCMQAYEMFLFNEERIGINSQTGVARIVARLKKTSDFFERAMASQQEFGFLGLHEALFTLASKAPKSYLRSILEGTEPYALREILESASLDALMDEHIDSYTRFCAAILKQSPYGEAILFELHLPDQA